MKRYMGGLIKSRQVTQCRKERIRHATHGPEARDEFVELEVSQSGEDYCAKGEI